MNIKRIFSGVIALALGISMTAPIHASESGVSASLTPSEETVYVGREVELTISAEGCFSEDDAIRGVQIDIGAVDSDIIEVISYRSMIINSDAEYNDCYTDTDGALRFVYADLDTALPIPEEGDGTVKLFAITLKPNAELTASGEITLPITVKLQTVSSQVTESFDYTLSYTYTGTAGAGVIGDADMNGKVNSIDLAYLQRYLAGWEGYDSVKVDVSVTDINGDGAVNTVDATILARHIAKWIGYETLASNQSSS